MKKSLKRREKILMILLLIAMIGVALRWSEVKEGAVKGWKYFNIVEWFNK
ncbi:MAG: hypothetical protein ACLFUW_05900 [Bacteroidales bacterium]